MYFLRRVAARALQSPSASLILRPRTITTTTRSRTPIPVSFSKQWATLPVQRRFASGEAEQLASDQVTSDGEIPSDTQAETTPTQPEEPAAIESSSAAEGVATEPVIAEEIPVVEPAATEASAASESAPTNDTLASAASAAGAAPAAANARSTPNARATGWEKGNFNNLTPNTTLYVGNLYFEVTEDALKGQFEQFGNIVRTRIIRDYRGLSKGFGYVEFEKQEDAASAVATMNQVVFSGRRMAVQYHRRRTPPSLNTSRSPNEPSKTLFIGNMSFEMSDKDLNDLFREVRNVVDVRVAIDRRTGQPRGFAHADFIDVESAVKAKEYLQAKEVYGRTLRVDFSKSSGGTMPR